MVLHRSPTALKNANGVLNALREGEPWILAFEAGKIGREEIAWCRPLEVLANEVFSLRTARRF